MPLLLPLLAAAALAAEPARRPNVLVVITDDQGYGDLGCHGNPQVKTPHLDKLHAAATRLTQFQVSPVCSPTRASLLTGRYNYRTGVVDTYLGRSLMRPDEVTLAEALAAAGYRTGIFGKWHLGDTAPLRATDQGFQHALVCTGGGLTQPSDPPGNSYFDPVLLRDGTPVKARGYCTAAFTDAAAEFVAAADDRPFFCYVAYNCPHTPLQVADGPVKPYKDAGLDDVTARVYAMVTDIDANLGRLFARLDAAGRAGDTLVLFLTDNGPQQRRYNGGMRGLKGSVYQGGVRVPAFWRWPGKLAAGRDVAVPAAHIDVFPTVLEACGVAPPAGVALDGLSLWPALTGAKAALPDRTLFAQWHRGDVPELNRAFAARRGRYKLVQAAGVPPGKRFTPRFELFDLDADPAEANDLSADRPEVVRRLRAEYEAWFKDVGARGYDPPRLHLGSPRENPATLTRQDWRGPHAGWAEESVGHWEVEVVRAGRYEVRLRFPARRGAATAAFRLGGVAREASVPEGAGEAVVGPVELPAGPARLEATLRAADGETGVYYVEVRRLD